MSDALLTVEGLNAYYGGAHRASGVSSTPSLAKTVHDQRVVDLCIEAIRAIDDNATGVFAVDLKEKLEGLRQVEVLVGPDAARILTRETEADMVLNGIVGAAGLEPTLAALQSGKTVALANKESLIVGGELVTMLAEGTGARIIPVDSEHSALFQLIGAERPGNCRGAEQAIRCYSRGIHPYGASASRERTRDHWRLQAFCRRSG